MQACNPCTQEAEAGESEFEANLNYIVRLCFKKETDRDTERQTETEIETESGQLLSLPSDSLLALDLQKPKPKFSGHHPLEQGVILLPSGPT